MKRLLALLVGVGLLVSCGGGGGSSPTAASTPAPAPVATVRIDKIKTDGVYQYDASKPYYTAGPAVDWHVTVSPGQGTWVRMTGFNAANAPCLSDEVDVTVSPGNGRVYFGNPRSAAEWNRCLPKVVKVVAELMATRASTAGIVKDERVVEWVMQEARESSGGGGGGSSCSNPPALCNVGCGGSGEPACGKPTAMCGDGKWSCSTGSGTCSGHGGVSCTI